MKHVDPNQDVKQRSHRKPNYLLVFVFLAAVTALEVAITYIPGVPLAPVLVALSLAKASAVLLYFMHLRFDHWWYAVIFLVPFVLVIPLVLVVRV
ncbi:MAG: hypothetical protein FJ011_08085 [Chloroflexi bacterium]|jgi:caa(3)-type oxidase subunit IV|nr:hypothetical protein [Chloroflexota bacterium]